jgi:WD40 repeat protein
MFWGRARSVGAVLLAAALAVGGGLFALPGIADRPKPAVQAPEVPPRAAEPKKLAALQANGGPIHAVAMAPDGKTLASAGSSLVELWEVDREGGGLPTALRQTSSPQNPSLIQPVPTHQGDILAVAFSPDGKTLASVPGYSPFRLPTQGESVKLWDLATGRVRVRLAAPAVWVWAVAFRADGQTVTTAGEALPLGKARGEVRLWDATTGEPRGMPLRVDHTAYAVAISARGEKKVLASAGECHLTKELLSPEQRKLPTSPGYRDGQPIIWGKITLWELDPPGGASP